MRILELYCGIGGVAAAVAGRAEVALAVDQSRLGLRVYRRNFAHPTLPKLIEAMEPDVLRGAGADLWWASPPCQPFTAKGRQRFLDDPRAATLRGLLLLLEAVRPPFFAFENVPGFVDSPGHDLLDAALDRAGYAHRREQILCPTDLGIPNRRPRFFLVAGRASLGEPPPLRPQPQPLAAYLDPEVDARFNVDPALVDRFRWAVDRVDPDDPAAVAACFTSGYGRSAIRCGSYLARSGDPMRRFTPAEIARLLGFPGTFAFPPEVSTRQAWKLLGNSLSVPCVRQVLAVVPALRYADAVSEIRSVTS